MEWARTQISSSVRSLKTSAKSPSASRRRDMPIASLEKKDNQEQMSQIAAPHPIPKGKENVPCPISGMFLSATEPIQEVDSNEGDEVANSKAREAMENDPDILAEKDTLMRNRIVPGQASPSSTAKMTSAVALQLFVPMEVHHGAHQPTAATRRLVEEIGGIPTLKAFTHLFYQRCFADPHIDRFIADPSEPHGDRFANWIFEKFGAGTPWTAERRTRPAKTLRFHGESVKVSHDRSSSHFAAWYSPKREPEKRGQHFKPDDARVWMRLHFWAAREVGLFDKHPAFMDYYTRFIGHFVSVYSGKAPPFTRESARWSADPENVMKYLANGNVMDDVIGKDVEIELLKLPEEERLYTGSKHPFPSWPYRRSPA